MKPKENASQKADIIYLGIIFALLALAIILTGCQTVKHTATTSDGYTPVTLDELRQNSDGYEGHKIVIHAYILGMEYGVNADDADQWIMVLGDQPQLDDGRANQLIFPEIDNKVRAAEDGYNREILRRCYEICRESRRKGSEIRVYGVYNSDRAYAEYFSGIDLMIDKITSDNTLINTDFNDHSVLKEKTPGYFKKSYKGVKKIAGVIGGVM